MSTKTLATAISIFIIGILTITLMWLATIGLQSSVKSGLEKLRTLTISEESINDNKIQPGPLVAGKVVASDSNGVLVIDSDTTEIVVQPITYQAPPDNKETDQQEIAEVREVNTINTDENANDNLIQNKKEPGSKTSSISGGGDDGEVMVGDEDVEDDINKTDESDASGDENKSNRKKDPWIIDLNSILSVHNNARAKVGVEKLSWSKDLATDAQLYADQLAKECDLVHEKGIDEGENLFYGWYQPRPDKFDSTIPSIAWVSEKEFYNHKDNNCKGGEVCGHYTQMVWADTTMVGCGQAQCSTGKKVESTAETKDELEIIQVCRYAPAGNYLGQRPY